MPVVRSVIPYRKSRRLRQTDPKHYQEDDDLWETYDETLLAPVTIKSEPDASYEDTPSLNPVPIPSEVTHIPRPRNAFICFRSAYVKAEKRVSARPGSLDQTVMSRGAADVWRGMDDTARFPYIRMAQEEKAEHALKYPNYRYSPGSANGAAKKSRRSKVVASKRGSTATREGSVVSTPDARKYDKNPPAARPVSRKKSLSSTASRPRRKSSASAVSPPAAKILEPVQEAPPHSPEPTPSPAVHVNKYDCKQEDVLGPQVFRSPDCPTLGDRRQTQFGFKDGLSSADIENVYLAPRTPSPAPFAAMAALSLDDVDTVPAAPVPKAWDSWMYAPLELLDDTNELDFEAPPADFGFFHPWSFDDAPRAFSLTSTSLDDVSTS